MSARRPLALLTAAAVAATTALVLAVPARAATAPPNVLHAPGVLRGGQQLLSLNANFRLRVTHRGRLELLTRWGRVLWSPRTGRHDGARLRLLRTGRLELVSRTGRQLWTTHTSGARVRLVARNSGVLALMRGRRTLWHTRTAIRYGAHDNPVPRARLDRGATLASGGRLTSANGAYHASMRRSGELALVGPGGTPWSTHTAGWDGATLTLTQGGNLVLRSASGVRLWSTHTSHGALLVLGGRGNLVLENFRGQPIWQSASSAQPSLAPPTSTSHYIRSTADLSTAGCADATANGAGKRAVVLHIGAQRTDVGATGNQWGVWLSAVNTPVTDGELVSLLETYLAGYGGCMASGGQLLLAVATNNDSRQNYSGDPTVCPLPPAGEPDPLGAAGGTDWADNVVAPLAAYAATWPGITVAGANDIEPAFAGCVTQAQAWVGALLSAPSAPYVFVGSADGCPTALGSGAACLAGWTQQQIYQLAYGLDPSRSIPLPQIYTTDMAAQWANVSAADSTPIRFGGVLTEVAACASAGGCTSLAGTTAWNALANQLSTAAGTRTSAGPYSTDLSIG